MFLEAILGLIACWFLWSVVTLELNYRRASTMGIPLIRLPIDPMNLAWQILEPNLTRLLSLPPFTWGAFGRYNRRGWFFRDKASSHLQYGPIYAHVTPCDIWVYVADPGAVHDIFARRADFLRPSKMYKVLEVYGPCISTAEWTDWPRHRKVLAAPFNESVMQFVWNESMKQAKSMVTWWSSSSDSETFSIAKDTRTLSLNVLAATGFRRSYDFQSRNQTSPSSGETQSYRDSLQTVLDNCILLMVAPRWMLSLSFMPKSWHALNKAAINFKNYMETMLQEETALLKEGKPGTGGLMTSFVRALNSKQDGDSKDLVSRAKGLSVDEIFGNIFVINFAGHDTTANTLAFCMLLLAANPEVQEWVSEELRLIETEECDYESWFPKLKRCRALLLETLRLYPPILALPKWTNAHPQILKVGERTIPIPPNTSVSPSLLAIHTHPSHWDNPLIWRPARWILASTSPFPPAKAHSEETLFTPAPNTYFPWSDGPQNCPGVRFSQVEFVAVMACLLRDHRLAVVLREGESAEQARKRVLDVVEDCDMELLLRMRDPERMRLVCKKVS